MKTIINILSLLTLTIAAISFLISCNNASNRQEQTSVDSAKPAPMSHPDSIIIKDTILYADSAEISGEKYFAYYLNNDKFFIINEHKDTLFTNNELCSQFEFDDFDKDGYKDIRFHYMSNTPSVQDLVLYNSKKKSFRKVENFSNFPEPIKIGKTKFYYSYHRSGCADMNWDSDLFYIENYKTYRIGNISGRECHDRDIKDGIYIHKISNEKEIVYKKLPIATIYSYDEHKWDFIKEYWTKNYTQFIR